MSVRGPSVVPLALKAKTIAAAGTTNSLAIDINDAVNFVTVQIVASAVSGTTPSLVLTAQWSMDGTNWSANDTPEAFAAITANGSVVKQFTPKGNQLRLQEVVTGTTPTFTYATNVLIN